MYKVHTTLSIDNAVLQEAKAQRINLSQTLEDALRMEITATSPMPENELPRDVLEHVLSKVRENQTFAYGQSKRIFNVHGIKISPEKLIEMANRRNEILKEMATKGEKDNEKDEINIED